MQRRYGNDTNYFVQLLVYNSPLPPNFESSSITKSSFTVSWNEPSDKGGNALGIGKYVIMWTSNIDNNSTEVNYDITETEIPGLTSNTHYSVSVAAQNTNEDNGAFSAPANETTRKLS